MLLINALALYASQVVHMTNTYTSRHLREFEHSRLTCTRLDDYNPSHATGAVSDIEPVAPMVWWGYTRILPLLILALVLELNNHRCELR